MEDPNQSTQPFVSEEIISSSTKSSVFSWKLVILVLISNLFVGALAFGFGTYYSVMKFGLSNYVSETTNNQLTDAQPEVDEVVCTMDAKLCPDGSSVGRVGPDCEFAACPAEVSSECQTFEFSSSNQEVEICVPLTWQQQPPATNNLAYKNHLLFAIEPYQDLPSATAVYPQFAFGESAYQSFDNGAFCTDPEVIDPVDNPNLKTRNIFRPIYEEVANQEYPNMICGLPTVHKTVQKTLGDTTYFFEIGIEGVSPDNRDQVISQFNQIIDTIAIK